MPDDASIGVLFVGFLALAVVVATFLISAAQAWYRPVDELTDEYFQYSRMFMGLFVGLNLLCLVVTRTAIRWYLQRRRLAGHNLQRILIVGAGNLGKEIAFTRVACRLLDGETCRCGQYEIRRKFVPDCVMLTPKTLPKVAYWLPSTCAYRLLHEGKPLNDWHPLISGTAQSVHDAGMSVQGWTIPEFDVDEDDWEDHIIEDL